MDLFDEYLQQIHVEDFTETLTFQGKIFGEIKLDLTKKEFLENMLQYREKFQYAQGVCICLSHDIERLDEEMRTNIFDMLENENIEAHSIKKNKTLECKEGLYSYQIIFSGLK